MLRNSRRSSLVGSNLSLSSIRRSSVNPKDIERIQAAIQRKQQVSSRIILVLLLAFPVFIFSYNCAVLQFEGSLLKLLSELSSNHQLIYRILPPPSSPTAWKIVIFLILTQFVFSHILPHDRVVILNQSGEREWRRINGFVSCLLLVLLYIMGAGLGFYNASIIYTHWTELLSVLNLLAILAVVYLYLRVQTADLASKRRNVNGILSPEGTATTQGVLSRFEVVAPLSRKGRLADSICDIFFGTELAPTVLEMDVKHFVTYRITLTLWPLFIVSALYQSFALHGKINDGLLACAALQLTYIGKSHWFEYLHFSSLDAQIDRAGFYRIWGVLVFLPSLYVTPVTIMVEKGTSVRFAVIIVLFALGLFSIYLTTDIDRQRFMFRYANGHTKIWGKDPFFITAKFRKENGDGATNLLLGSGWWGLSRHLNYFTEWLSFLFWTLLQGSTAFLPYIPLIFLAIFLHRRMMQDETRCLAKYGQHWLQYANRVPFLLIPSMY